MPRRLLTSRHAPLLTHAALIALTAALFALLQRLPLWIAFVPCAIIQHRIGVLLHEYIHGIPFRRYRTNLLVLSVGYFATITVSDSKSNVWVPLTPHTAGSAKHQFFFAANPVVGTGHTFTVTGAAVYPGLVVHAYAGSVRAPVFESENGAAGSSGTSRTPGSVTPTVNGSLIVSGLELEGHLLSLKVTLFIERFHPQIVTIVRIGPLHHIATLEHQALHKIHAQSSEHVLACPLLSWTRAPRRGGWF